MSLFSNTQSSSSQSQGGSLFGQSNQQNRGTGLFGTSSANTSNTAPSHFNNPPSGFGGGTQGTAITGTGQGIFGQAKNPSFFGHNTGTTTGSTGMGGVFNIISSSNVATASSSSFFPASNNMSNQSGSFASSGSPNTQTVATSSGSLFATQVTQKSPFANTTETISSPPKLDFTLTAEQIKALFPQMLKNQSSVVSKFTISNEFGKIDFEENRDVKEKDLDTLSELKQKVDSLLKNDLSAETAQLHKGEKLDKPATVTLYNCSGENKKYEEIAKQMGCQFVDYDTGNKMLKMKILYL